MNKSVILFLIAFLPFCLYFFHVGFVGVDSWANFNYVCGVGSYNPPGAWGLVLDLLPCNEFVLKGLQFVSYWLVILLIALLGEKVFGVDGWKLGVFAGGLCPLLFQIALNFEAQWFGFVVVWVGFLGFVLINGVDKKC